MYRVPAAVKRDPVRRWALPDRVFFACGACHILAHAFLERYPDSGFRPAWIRPAPGFAGNHIVLIRADMAFDYHGYSSWSRLVDHMSKRASRWWPGWRARVEWFQPECLTSEAGSRARGLWLREPGQFLHDPRPRARRFLSRFPAPHAHDIAEPAK